jgi:hypothetical protein
MRSKNRSGRSKEQRDSKEDDDKRKLRTSVGQQATEQTIHTAAVGQNSPDGSLQGKEIRTDKLSN